MLPKPHRLRKDRDIQAVLRKGARTYGELVGVRAKKVGDAESRFAFVVGTKVSKRAIKRNRLKRRMREAVREVLAKVQSGHDVMLMAKNEALEAPYEALKTDVHAVLKKAGLL